MMEAQHAWVQEIRYEVIETNPIQDNSAMLALNLHAGFRVNGFHTRDEILRIDMTKQLAEKPEARTQSGMAAAKRHRLIPSLDHWRGIRQ